MLSCMHQMHAADACSWLDLEHAASSKVCCMQVSRCTLRLPVVSILPGKLHRQLWKCLSACCRQSCATCWCGSQGAGAKCLSSNKPGADCTTRLSRCPCSIPRTSAGPCGSICCCCCPCTCSPRCRCRAQLSSGFTDTLSLRSQPQRPAAISSSSDPSAGCLAQQQTPARITCSGCRRRHSRPCCQLSTTSASSSRSPSRCCQHACCRPAAQERAAAGSAGSQLAGWHPQGSRPSSARSSPRLLREASGAVAAFEAAVEGARDGQARPAACQHPSGGMPAPLHSQGGAG